MTDLSSKARIAYIGFYFVQGPSPSLGSGPAPGHRVGVERKVQFKKSKCVNNT